MKDRIKQEPVAFWGLLTELVLALFGVAILFGVDLTQEQVGGILVAFAALGALVVFFVRSKVTPV